MANSSFNSSFSLKDATARQFEEAFEELYRHTSPLPKLSKPFFPAREKLMAPPVVPGHSRLKIKAIFDTMKERNSSMCSELNSSICTSNASFSEVAAETGGHSAKNCLHSKEKENQTPSPGRDQDEVDCLAAHSESPRNSHLPPAPESPAMRAALSFARHAARLDGLPTASSLGSKNSDNKTRETRSASIIAMIDKSTKNNRETDSCCPRKRLYKTRTADKTAPSASRHITKPKHIADLGDTNRDLGKDAENVTEEICLPHCPSSEKDPAPQNVQETGNSQTALLATMTLESAILSPTDKASDESCADQETMQLVSKLVQRLQSSTKNSEPDDQDGDDDWDVSKPVPPQLKEKPSIQHVAPSKSAQYFVSKNGKVSADILGKTAGTSVRNHSVSNKRKAALDSKKKGGENQTAEKTTSRSSEPEKKKIWTRTLRSRKRGPPVTETSSAGEEERSTRVGKKSALRSSQKKPTEEQDNKDSVEADVIAQQMVKPVENTKDPFSLDISSDEDDLHVEEDAITCATKKPGNRKPPRRKAARAVNRAKPVSKGAAKEQKNGGNVAPTGRNKDKILKLSSWSLQPVARLKSVRIEGKLPNTDYFWLSSVIVERVSSRILKSTNGSLYQLVGNMAVLNTRAAGFSAEIAQLFRRGFPLDWKDLLESSVAGAELQSKTLVTSTLPIHSKRNSKTGERSAGKKTAQGGKCTPPRRNVKKKADASSLHTPQRTQTNMDDSSAIWTPQGVMSRIMEAKEVRRTQSGRSVIPPLARWAGQYLERDDDGNVTIGFASLAAEQHFAKIAQHELHAPVRLRNSPMCTRIKTVRTGNAGKGNLHQQKGGAAVLASSKGKESTNSVSRSGVAEKASSKEGNNELCKGVQSDASDGNSNTEMKSLEKEVMSVIQKSKRRRLQKAVGKRTTCYANAADDPCPVTDKTVSQSLKNADRDKDIISQMSPVKGGEKAVSVAKSFKKSARDVAEKTGPRGRKQSRQQQSEKSAQQKTLSVRARKQSDSVDKEEIQSNNNIIRNRAPRPRAAARGRKKAESVRTTDTGDKDCSENNSGNEPHPTDTVSSASSSALTTVGISKSSRRGRGSTQTNMPDKDTEIANPDNTTKKKLCSRQPRVNGGRKKLDEQNDRLSGVEMEVSSDHSDFETDSKKKAGGRRRKAQNNTRNQKQQAHDEKGQKKTVQSKAKNAKSLQKEDPSSADLDGSRSWSEEEIQNLHRGIESISSDHPEFWECVSQYVGGRTSKECAAFYLKDNNDKGPSGKPKEQKKKQSDMTPVIRGKRGTLKRRQELRAILEHDSNNNNPDDLFSATPFRMGKRAKVAAVDFSKTDEEVFGRNPNFFTPRTGQCQLKGRAFSHTPASSRKTPAIAVTNSPWLLKDSAQKKDIDLYLHRLQKNKRQLTKSFNKKKSQPCKEKEAGTPSSTTVRLFNQSPVPDGVFRITEEQSHNEEDEEDYYYSEEEN